MHRFDNRQTLAAICQKSEARFTLYHGTGDDLIPARMSAELAAAHPGKVTFHPVPGGHNDVLLHLQTTLKAETLRLSSLK
jgi:fermentation-respiration switch protein FrsA (DUF1100 family)